MSNLRARRTEIQNQINALGEAGLIEQYGLPVAGVIIPKQKALRRITQNILGNTSLVFQSAQPRVDHTYGLDPENGRLFRICIAHNNDALNIINRFDGRIKASTESTQTIPVIAIVGFDAFASQRNEVKAQKGPWEARIETLLQTTTAGLVFAARKKDSLERLDQQDKIAVAATYAGIYKRFLTEAFGEAKAGKIELIPRKGGTESTSNLLPGVEVIGDLTDTGGSLMQNNLHYVIPVSDSAPVIVTHMNLNEQTAHDDLKEIQFLIKQFGDASKQAYPEEQAFDPRQSGHAIPPSDLRDKDSRIRNIMTLDEYLKSRRKTGKRKDAGEEGEVFYNLEPDIA